MSTCIGFPHNKPFVHRSSTTLVEMEWFNFTWTTMANFEVQTKSSEDSTWSSTNVTGGQRFNVTRCPPNTLFEARVRGEAGNDWTHFTPSAQMATTPALASSAAWLKSGVWLKA